MKYGSEEISSKAAQGIEKRSLFYNLLQSKTAVRSS